MLDASKVMRGVTGVVSRGPANAALPTAVNSALVGYNDLGWVGEDGITRSNPSAGDREVIRGWQNNGVVLVIRTPSEDNPTFQFILLETKIEVVEFVLGVTVVQSATDGKWVVDTEKARDYHRIVFDIVHGSRLRRVCLPKGIVAELGDQVYAFGEPVGWEVTIEAEKDLTVGGQLIEFDSALATPATWAATTSYNVGARIKLSTGEQLEASTPGTGGASEPVAPAALGGTVTDGTVVWTRYR
ncbi:MAG TPA: hypothetical protein VNS46_00180 [Nocardioides sp.]|nr:hypothetical protein [Nocardioides sp.]